MQALFSFRGFCLLRQTCRTAPAARTARAARTAAAVGVDQRNQLVIINKGRLVINIHCNRVVVVIVATAAAVSAAISVH